MMQISLTPIMFLLLIALDRSAVAGSQYFELHIQVTAHSPEFSGELQDIRPFLAYTVSVDPNDPTKGRRERPEVTFSEIRLAIPNDFREGSIQLKVASEHRSTRKMGRAASPTLCRIGNTVQPGGRIDFRYGYFSNDLIKRKMEITFEQVPAIKPTVTFNELTTAIAQLIAYDLDFEEFELDRLVYYKTLSHVSDSLISFDAGSRGRELEELRWSLAKKIVNVAEDFDQSWNNRTYSLLKIQINCVQRVRDELDRRYPVGVEPANEGGFHDDVALLINALRGFFGARIVNSDEEIRTAIAAIRQDKAQYLSGTSRVRFHNAILAILNPN